MRACMFICVAWRFRTEVSPPQPLLLEIVLATEASPRNQLGRVDASQSPEEKEGNFHQRALVKTTEKRRKKKKERKKECKSEEKTMERKR